MPNRYINTKRIAKHMIKAVKILEKHGVEVEEFYIDAEDGKARNFIARSIYDKKVGF